MTTRQISCTDLKGGDLLTEYVDGTEKKDAKTRTVHTQITTVRTTQCLNSSYEMRDPVRNSSDPVSK